MLKLKHFNTVLAGKNLFIAKTSPKMAKLHNLNRLAKFEKKIKFHSALINMLQKFIKFINFIFISLLFGLSCIRREVEIDSRF